MRLILIDPTTASDLTSEDRDALLHEVVRKLAQATNGHRLELVVGRMLDRPGQLTSQGQFYQDLLDTAVGVMPHTTGHELGALYTGAKRLDRVATTLREEHVIWNGLRFPYGPSQVILGIIAQPRILEALARHFGASIPSEGLPRVFVLDVPEEAVNAGTTS
jgi:hypothetical protein